MFYNAIFKGNHLKQHTFYYLNFVIKIISRAYFLVLITNGQIQKVFHLHSVVECKCVHVDQFGYVYDKYQVHLDKFLYQENVKHSFQMLSKLLN